MNPPPPMLPALGWVTASAKAVATAASTAVPPLARTPAPASHAGADVHTTRPSLDETPWSGAASVHGRGAAMKTSAMPPRMPVAGRILLFRGAVYTNETPTPKRCRQTASHGRGLPTA